MKRKVNLWFWLWMRLHLVDDIPKVSKIPNSMWFLKSNKDYKSKKVCDMYLMKWQNSFNTIVHESNHVARILISRFWLWKWKRSQEQNCLKTYRLIKRRINIDVWSLHPNDMYWETWAYTTWEVSHRILSVICQYDMCTVTYSHKKK